MEIKMKKIFVGNLSWKVTEEILRPIFEAYGKVVSVKIIPDQYTGKSNVFGFVEMESPEAAEKAIRELNDKPVLERNIRVSPAQERQPRTDFNNTSRGGGGHKSYRPRTADRSY